MSTSTSVGQSPDSGGNENHDGDARATTLGETVRQNQQPPAGRETPDATQEPQPPADAG